MRVPWIMAVILFVMQGVCCAQTQQFQLQISASQLVREMVYNELHDHDRHGYWRYWIERHAQKETRLEEQVETTDGPVTRLVLSNGRPLDAASREQEQARLDHLLSSPAEQARRRQDYADDEKRIGRILVLLPDAFLYESAGDENGCIRLRFRPNPNYPAHSIEARIFHAMSGELWVNERSKRLARLDGRLEDNVDFGFGLLGRLYKGGWFRLDRTQASATDWKTARLEIHMSGRAFLLKSIARETSEQRGGFAPVPAGMNLAQGLTLLDRSASTSAQVMPTVFSMRR
jgi:hypothetical protein